MRTAEQRQFHIAGVVWNIWANYWTGLGELIPPLHYLRMGGGEDFIFVSGVSEKALDGFITAVKSAPELSFQKQGDWWLHSSNWYGHWTTFSATLRPSFVGLSRLLSLGESTNVKDPGPSSGNPTNLVQESNQPEMVRSEASTKKRGWGRWGSRNEGTAK